MLRPLRLCLTFILFGTLAACQSSEEKAEDFYQSGLALLEAGDLDRAALEFLNVFEHNGLHKDARRKLADLRLEQGDVAAAYGQYLRLIEQYPDTPDVRLILAEVALDNGDWDETRRHGLAALELVPEDPRAQSLGAALTYRDAVEAQDTDARQAAFDTARALLEADPSDDVSRRVVIDHLLRSDTPFDAMGEIDRALQDDPENYGYNMMRLRLLTQVGNMAAMGTQLQRMVALFPEDEDLSRSLIGWYLAQGDMAGAEAYLRELAGDPTGPTEGHIAVVQLLQTAQGPEAAKAELDRLAEANAGTPNGETYRALSAVLRFELGEQDAAIATIEEIVGAAEPSESIWRIRNILARLLLATGNQVGARAQVETILAEDASNVEALKLRAGWAIDDDRAGDAIVDLRTALGQEPRDAEILTLMARAHEREGSLALAGERLALAVDVSGAGAEESLRYAAFLQREGRPAAARTVLSDARTANPRNIQILSELAQLLLGEESWVQAQDIANDLRAIDTPAAQEAANSLQAALLLGQNRIEDSLSFLKDKIAQGDGNTNAIAQVVQIQLQSGNTEGARSYLDEALQADPGNPTLRLLSANLSAVSGDFTTAEAGFRALIDDFPEAEGPVLRLYNLLVSTGQAEAAEAVIDAALAAQPTSMNLRWIRAGKLEQAGDIDGAIAIYEEMYATNSNAVTIANNLASLIATHKDDPESLDRAATIAKRLREFSVPPFQDTYGWIAYRQGNYDEARRYLEPAAAGLPDDPLVQYHLGMTYAALAEVDKARETLTRALEIAGDSPLPQFDRARETLQGLPAAEQ